MTRRMPVLPQSHCDACPCTALRTTPGLSLMYCRVLNEELWASMPLRTGYCIRDELAWRNVAAGLAMVAFEWRHENAKTWLRVGNAQKPAPA